MSNPSSKKKSRIWILVVIAVAVAAFFGWKYWQAQKTAVPKGIAYGNGRLEAKLVDATAKEALRVKTIFVNEGDIVKPGQVLVKLDTVTLDAELLQAKASVAAAREKLAIAAASISKTKSQIELAKIEADRARKLVEENAGSQQSYDIRKTTVETTTAALAEEQAKLQTAKEEVVVAEANVATIQTRIDDATLTSPVLGRVLYRLSEPGEVLGPGGKALTLVNLEDVYMEIFVPAEVASKVKMGAEARIQGDYDMGRVAPAYVSFVSPEAQFTPKQVETKSEREKLMFRVKLQVPKELVGHYIAQVKTGVRGVGYVKVDDSVPWPSWLSQLIPAVPVAATAESTTPADTTAATGAK